MNEKDIMKTRSFKRKKIDSKKYKITLTNTGIANAISISITSWCSIKEQLEIENINKQIKQLQFQLKQYLYQFTSNNILLQNQYIVDVDAAESGLLKNNLAFLQIDLMIYGTPTEKCKKELIDNLQFILDNSKVFNFQKSKKG